MAIIQATRSHAQIQVGASPRGGLALVQLARAQALLEQRDFVIPDDVKRVAVPALAHRITLRPELWVRQVRSDDVIASAARRPCRSRAPIRRQSLADAPAAQAACASVPVRWGLSAHARRLVTLALAGLIIAIVTRRAEFAGLAAPALLLLATWRSDRAGRADRASEP